MKRKFIFFSILGFSEFYLIFMKQKKIFENFRNFDFYFPNGIIMFLSFDRSTKKVLMLRFERNFHIFFSIFWIFRDTLGYVILQLCHQWCWFDQLPFVSASHPTKIFHPKTEELGLLAEVVVAISGAVVRASVITQSNKDAVFYRRTKLLYKIWPN